MNARDARARDVQALFADLAGGARSFAMVGQGRVGALVQARPEERRGLLDEAAGIAGLHARRAEADGKLRAAEANLLRAGDRRQEMDAQLDGLRRQAWQAERHRELSERVATAEAGLLALVRARAAAARDAAAAGRSRRHSREPPRPRRRPLRPLRTRPRQPRRSRRCAGRRLRRARSRTVPGWRRKGSLPLPPAQGRPWPLRPTGTPRRCGTWPMPKYLSAITLNVCSGLWLGRCRSDMPEVTRCGPLRTVPVTTAASCATQAT